jgi:hypothetical protein
MYANSADTSWYPALLFARGRRVGATVGYAHFNGSTPHSSLLMDVAAGDLDFVEVMQFGVLKTAEWYELLDAGFRITGIAGSDFPVQLNRSKTWPRWIPLLGPERTLVKTRASADPYTAWAAGIRQGNVVVSNGPLVEIESDGAQTTVTAHASFYRPLVRLEIVRNGEVLASVPGDGKARLSVSARLRDGESCWVAARVTARKQEDEPEIQAHTNPLYFPRAGKPFVNRQARQALAAKWKAQLDWYRSGPLVFHDDAARSEFFARGEKALTILTTPPE